MGYDEAVRRKLFKLTAAISLVLFLAALMMRSASAERTRFHAIGDMHRPYAIGSRGEYLALGRMKFPLSPPPRDPMSDIELMITWRQRNGGHGDMPSALGWDFYDEAITPNDVFFGEIESFQVVAVSYGALLFWLAVLPGAWLFHAIRGRNVQRRRLKGGRCPQCGYDLRGSPERCPECGHVPDPTNADVESHRVGMAYLRPEDVRLRHHGSNSSAATSSVSPPPRSSCSRSPRLRVAFVR